MGLHNVRTARSEICPICKADASVIADQYSGYQDTYCYRILECEYCDLQFVDPMIVPPGLYDGIYRNSDRLPGYKRYREYRDLIARSKDKSSLSWLAAQEPAYWFVCSELASLSPSARILEVGSGLGYLTYAIHSAGYNIIGIDISNDAITEARSSFGGFYLHKDLNALALEEPNSFDAVIMTEVIEHVPTPRTFLDAAASLLKPGGQIILTTPNKSNAPLGVCWDTESPPVHLWWFSETAMRRLAQNSCLSIRMGDFRSMYQGRKPYSVPPAKSGPPPFLDSSGQVTDAAKRWQAGRLWLANLENHSGKLRPFVKTVRRVKRSYPALLQRNWQMGVVLAKRPAVRGDGM